MRQKLESHSGVGAIYAADELICSDVRYQFTRWQNFNPDGQGGQIPALGTCEGVLRGLDFDQSFKLVEKREIDLQFEDGRRWPCFLTNTSTGRLGSRGEPK